MPDATVTDLRPAGSVPTDKDIEVIDKCLAGDFQAFRILVEKYQNPIMNLIYRLTGNYHNAEDIAQDTFVSAYTSLGKFRRGASFFSWLYEIALNKSKDYLKNTRRNEKPLPDNQESKTITAYDNLKATDEMNKIQNALSQLSDEYREAFVLKHIEELSYQQMQEIVGVSITSLKVRVHRARELLADLLGSDKSGGKK